MTYSVTSAHVDANKNRDGGFPFLRKFVALEAPLKLHFHLLMTVDF